MEIAALETMRTEEIAALVAAGAAILARRAGAQQRPAQLALLPEAEHLDPATVDLDERLPDGSRRWLSPKEAAPRKKTSADSIIRSINEHGAGIKRGGRYYYDAQFIRSRN